MPSSPIAFHLEAIRADGVPVPKRVKPRQMTQPSMDTAAPESKFLLFIVSV